MVPKFDPPSSLTVVEDAMRISSNQKKLLKKILIRNSQRLNLTTEMWTCQLGLEYMCLTQSILLTVNGNCKKEY